MVISQPHSIRGPIRLRSSSVPSQMVLAPAAPSELITLSDLHRELLDLKLLLRPWYQQLWDALRG